MTTSWLHTGYFWNNTEPTQKLWWASCWTLDTDTKKKHWLARIAFLQLVPLANIFHKQNQHFQTTREFFGGRKRASLPVFVWYFIFSWFSFHICTDIIYGVKCGEHVLGCAPTKRIFMVLTKHPDLCKWTFYKKNGGNNCMQWAGGKCEASIDVEKF